MALRKRTWRWRKRAWRGTIVKVARGNTKEIKSVCALFREIVSVSFVVVELFQFLLNFKFCFVSRKLSAKLNTQLKTIRSKVTV